MLPDSFGHLGFGEFHAPRPDTAPLTVVSLAAPQYLAGRDAELHARVVDAADPDSVTLFVRATPGGFYRSFSMRRAGAYEYAVSIPAGSLREGPHEFAIAAVRAGSAVTFPAGVAGKPTDWNYNGQSSWRFDVVTPRTPLRLFDPGTDAGRLTFTRIGDAGRRGLFRVALSPATGQPVFHLELPTDTSGWSPADYTASLVIRERIAARQETIASANELRIRLRGLGARQTAHITLMEDDGTSWTAAVQIDTTWQDQVIPLASFTIGRGVLLPQGFPGEWNYWVGPAEGRGGAGDRLRLAHLERLQLSVRRNEGRGVEVESVVLGFGG